MLAILSLASLPLGGVAVFSSLNAAYTSRVSDVNGAEAALDISSQRVSTIIARAALVFRVASSIAAHTPAADAQQVCDRTQTQLSDYRLAEVRFALYATELRMACVSRGYQPVPIGSAASTALSRFRISDDGSRLVATLYGSGGQPEAQFEMPTSVLEQQVQVPDNSLPVEFSLVDDQGGTMMLRQADRTISREVNLEQSLLSGRITARLRTATAPLSPQEILLTLLPILLWLAGGLIGWLVVQRLLLRPLQGMQKAIAAYVPGEKHFVMPEKNGPSPEIAELGYAFEKATQTVASHEAELEAAVERQTKLVREVHHRVKNNLQVVASLLNLHSRGNTSEEAAAAYASIQRRVDALAVVHRNHYAELEENKGVALKALISELGASLRASAPSKASSMQIRLAIEPLYATQDVAASIAFLMTETVEFAMLCGTTMVTMTLEPEPAAPGRARLTLESDALTGQSPCPDNVQDRFERIVTGLARQLRSELLRDTDAGRYSLTIAVAQQTVADAEP